ncbi:MAG TPA: hypothetical protein VFF33_15015 [Ignavibacteriaceae bacterium]|nr:hypothetical protein [Ignavibacteriaceae bacterium]
MKNTFILWTASIIITFLVGYFYNITDSKHPISSSLFLGDNKITYKFDKVTSDKNYKVMIYKDTSKLSGNVLWRLNSPDEWKTIAMKDSDKVLYAYLPEIKPVSKVQYKVLINYDNKTQQLPPQMIVDMKVIGKVDGSTMGLYYFTLFGGMLLAVRSALEYFRNNKNTKKIFLFSIALFFAYFIAVDPLKTTLELAALNNSVPGITQLFHLHPLMILLTSIITMVILFSLKKKVLPINIISAVIIILIFLLVRF